jgi:DNA-binding GntR family transcriptional regulator
MIFRGGRMEEEGEPLRLREKAYVSFTRHLLARAVRPGQFVSQRELVALTGLPLGAIRELVPRLEAEGLLTTIPQRGIQIAHIDLTLIRDAFQFRLFMEKEAVALFTVSASDALLAQLRRQHEEMLVRGLSDTLTPEMVEQAQAVDWNLHDTIIDSIGNEIIAKAYRVNSIKMRLINQERFRIDGRVVPVMREHLAILAAIESREPQRAVDAIAEHINNARALALQV